MPLYEYRCRECSYDTLSSSQSEATDSTCSCCGGAWRRVYSVNVPSPKVVFEPHYNYTVGANVNSWQDFSDKLKRRSEQNTNVTGIEHTYTPLHPSDMKPQNVGATEEGLNL